MKYIEFTPRKIEQLKTAHDKAKAEGKETFMFEGQELLVSYAFYLIQYLEDKYNGQQT